MVYNKNKDILNTHNKHDIDKVCVKNGLFVFINRKISLKFLKTRIFENGTKLTSFKIN